MGACVSSGKVAPKAASDGKLGTVSAQPSPVAAAARCAGATRTKIDGWCSGLPKDRDICNPDQPKQVEKLADDIVASVDRGEVSIEDLKSMTCRESKDFPVMFITAIQAAESALKLRQCPPHHHTIIHAMYNEHERIKSKAELAEGQDFVRVKVGSMNWLYGKYAAQGSSWNYIAVDDGCPQESGKLMEAVIEKEGYKNVEVVYIQSAIDNKIPPFDRLQTTKDSRKGGSILYGLHCAAQMNPGKKHVASYYDADLSADLTLSGLLVHPILCEGKKLGVGQRYGCSGSFLALPEGANGHPHSLYANTDCFRMMFRHFARGILMPSLKPVYDTQCAFKSIEVDKLAEIVPKINEFGPGFDMELLIVAGKFYGGDPFELVPFLFVEDKAGSTMSSTDDAATKSFHNMLKAMVQIHERCFADAQICDADKAWIQFFRDVPLEGYQKMIAGIAAKLGPTPPEALDTMYVLEECKALAGM